MTNRYALGQLGRAFHTATSHEDPEVRRRADRRAQRWAQAIQGMADGRIGVGSRVPVRGLPSWVTLDVLRGGFATGNASAETPLQSDELSLAARLGIPATRQFIFGYYLTDDGLEDLYRLLDSGAYRVEIPEDTALLTIAWLVRAGDREAALDVLDAVSPFAERFRLAPKTANAPTSPPDFVYRITAGEAAESLRARKPNPRVEAQREALAVWNPFGDRVLVMWLEKYHDGQILFEQEPEWRVRATELVDEYYRLAAIHTRCTKHRKPKENLSILLRALRAATAGEELDARDRGLVRTAIEDSVRKRGVPGSDDHVTLRDFQRTVAAAPAHCRLAAVAAERLHSLDPLGGIEHPDLFVGAVTRQEATASGIRAGFQMPPIVPRLLGRAHSAQIETLFGQGVVPSAEVLALMVPRISATIVAAGFPDPALATLAAANYRAFRRRRSLLLLNLAKQVQLSELPWVRAVARYGEATSHDAMQVAQQVGALALDHFPGTIIPNPLVRELQHLLSSAGHDIPLVEELAADIFMGRFSDKYRRAAQLAARLIGGTLYARYYGVDADQLLGLIEQPKNNPLERLRRLGRPSEPGLTFADLCSGRAERRKDTRSVAASGTVIEQAQILTTHNLAALVSLGIRPTRAWTDLARDAIGRTADLLALAARQQRPLATVKDAAYAWRQATFFLCVAGPAESEAVLNDESIGASGPAVMAELLAGLRNSAAGQPSDGVHSPFLGWTVGRHWILDAIGYQSTASE